jgi:hypothetical protein
VGADRDLHGPDSRLHTVHRAVIASLEAQLGPLAELATGAVPWFSATFEGMRHELHFAAVDPARLAALEADNALALLCPDHVIVSVGTEQVEDRASVHVLTICCD